MSTRPYTDEELVAYSDGEASKEQASEIAIAAAADPKLAQRIDLFVGTRRVLRESFATVASEPVPQHLLQIARGSYFRADQSAAVSNRPRSRWQSSSAWIPVALAASLVMGVCAGWLGRGAPRNTPVFAGLPTDLSGLSIALNTLASGVPYEGRDQQLRYEVLPISTFKTATGEYCRGFESSIQSSGGVDKAHGIACRKPDGAWRPSAIYSEANSAQSSSGDKYIAASGPTLDLEKTLGPKQLLTPSQEEALIKSGWGKSAP